MLRVSDRQSQRTRLLEVANRAGVSVSTVSLVLAGKSANRRISEDTRDRVRKIAEDLNYAPNLLTRSLRRGRTHILSFYSAFRNREEADVYMDSLSSAIELAGGDAGYDILLHCNFKRSPKEIYQFLNGGLADGLILFAPHPFDPLLALLHNSSLPVVILNGRDPQRLLPSVADDVEMGMRLVTNNLLERGHRRIAILSPDGDSRDAERRIRLLRANLRESGIEIPNGWIHPCGNDAKGAVAALLDQPEPPSAVFCWHDRVAYGFLAACEALGVRVPEQISVVGYDGLYWPSATRHVAASVSVDHRALARAAVGLLDLYIDGYDGPLREDVFPVTFSTGTSLGPA